MDAKVALNGIARVVGEFLSSYDVLVTPTITVPAPSVDYLDLNDPSFDSEELGAELFRYAAFTPLFNATGHPAISLPLGIERRRPADRRAVRGADG